MDCSNNQLTDLLPLSDTCQWITLQAGDDIIFSKFPSEFKVPVLSQHIFWAKKLLVKFVYLASRVLELFKISNNSQRLERFWKEIGKYYSPDDAQNLKRILIEIKKNISEGDSPDMKKKMFFWN